MPFSVVTTVRFDEAADVDQVREGLHSQVIPAARQAPGFQRGIWSADRENSRGIGITVFETREQAEAVMQRWQSGAIKPPTGVTMETTSVYEVEGEA